MYKAGRDKQLRSLFSPCCILLLTETSFSHAHISRGKMDPKTLFVLLKKVDINGDEKLTFRPREKEDT